MQTERFRPILFFENDVNERSKRLVLKVAMIRIASLCLAVVSMRRAPQVSAQFRRHHHCFPYVATRNQAG